MNNYAIMESAGQRVNEIVQNAQNVESIQIRINGNTEEVPTITYLVTEYLSQPVESDPLHYTQNFLNASDFWCPKCMNRYTAACNKCTTPSEKRVPSSFINAKEANK